MAHVTHPFRKKHLFGNIRNIGTHVGNLFFGKIPFFRLVRCRLRETSLRRQTTRKEAIKIAALPTLATAATAYDESLIVNRDA